MPCHFKDIDSKCFHIEEAHLITSVKVGISAPRNNPAMILPSEPSMLSMASL